MKVFKVADIVEGEIAFSAQARFKLGDIAALLTNLEPAEPPNPNCGWKFEIEIGQGPSARLIKLDLPPLISVSHSLDKPIPLGNHALVFFRDRLFIPERPPKSAAEREEIALRVKKAVYEEDADIASLKAAVANLEAAIQWSRSGPRRESIPEDVKLVVWTRDGGACMRCGSKQALHFDHIIPVSKGGGNSEANIQVLCQICNLTKADKISTA